MKKTSWLSRSGYGQLKKTALGKIPAPAQARESSAVRYDEGIEMITRQGAKKSTIDDGLSAFKDPFSATTQRSFYQIKGFESPRSEQVVFDHIPFAANLLYRCESTLLKIIFYETTGYNTSGDVLQQQTNVTAIQDRAIGNVHASRIFNHQASGILYIRDVKSGKSTIFTIDYPEAAFRFQIARIVRVVIKVIRAHHNIAATFKQHVVLKAFPKGIAGNRDAPAIPEVNIHHDIAQYIAGDRNIAPPFS